MANEERRTPELTDRFGNLTLEGRKRAEQQKQVTWIHLFMPILLQQYFFHFQEILAREAEKECRVVLEICPKVLIPDTNTFIDHLPLIQKIIQSGLYTVTIPCIGT